MVTAATLGASALLALTGGALGQASQLRVLDPASLRPIGGSVRLAGWACGVAWARSGPRIAVVTKPCAGTQPVRLVDVPRMRAVGAIDAGRRDVLGMTFRGSTLVALAADAGRLSVVRFDIASRRVASMTPVPGLRSAWPTNLAFGDGFAFVTRAGGAVYAIDLLTGAVTRHLSQRTLAKGEGIVPTRWLGRHQLGVGGRTVDVRSWRARIFEPGARGVAPAGDDLAVYGPRGVAMYTRTGRLRFRVLSGVAVDNVHVRGRYLYAGAGPTADVVDLLTRRETRSVAESSLVWAMLES
jgi:hypothetical protein